MCYLIFIVCLVFSFRNYNWFWVPIVGPMVGSLLSWVIYSLFVQIHWPDDEYDMDEVRNVDDELPKIQSNGITDTKIQSNGITDTKAFEAYNNKAFTHSGMFDV